jgi:PAS domain S-box-containing protein
LRAPIITDRPTADETLDQHLTRIEAYMRGCALLGFPRSPSPLRDELAAILSAAAPTALDAWMQYIGRAFGIAEAQWAGIRVDMDAALARWIRHVADPTDTETYEVLRSHASRGFISKFPPSRFLAGQMKLFELLAGSIRSYPGDRARRVELIQLFAQEFEERILHITDFFVEAREQQLRDQEATYRRSIDSAPAAIFKIDCEDGSVLAANFVAERTLGWTSGELLGRKLWELLPAGERDDAVSFWEETRARGNASRDDVHMRTRDGESVPMFMNAGVIEYADQRFIQLICVDISDRKRLEDQLIQSEKMAAIGQLAAGLAHEIRNPLGIITNALYDLSELVDGSNDEIREDLRIAKEEMDRVQAIINTLLEFSRESKAELEPVDVNDLIRKTLVLMTKYLQNNDVRVVTELEDIGLCTANQNALRQILLNLITNAVQAMPHGGELRIRTARGDDGRMHLEFSDTGVGIPEDQIKDIFNPFFTTKSPGQGTGLGLSIVHSVVQRYHGDIQVRSTPNVGTTFTIDMPCGCDVEAA